MPLSPFCRSFYAATTPPLPVCASFRRHDKMAFSPAERQPRQPMFSIARSLRWPKRLSPFHERFFRRRQAEAAVYFSVLHLPGLFQSVFAEVLALSS
jgi:hypothetical protein